VYQAIFFLFFTLRRRCEAPPEEKLRTSFGGDPTCPAFLPCVFRASLLPYPAKQGWDKHGSAYLVGSKEVFLTYRPPLEVGTEKKEFAFPPTDLLWRSVGEQVFLRRKLPCKLRAYFLPKEAVLPTCFLLFTGSRV